MRDPVRITRITPLELTMRDVLANMGEFSAEFGFDPMAANTFQILSIEPPEPPARRRADVIPLRRSAVA